MHETTAKRRQTSARTTKQAEFLKRTFLTNKQNFFAERSNFRALFTFFAACSLFAGGSFIAQTKKSACKNSLRFRFAVEFLLLPFFNATFEHWNETQLFFSFVCSFVCLLFNLQQIKQQNKQTNGKQIFLLVYINFILCSFSTFDCKKKGTRKTILCAKLKLNSISTLLCRLRFCFDLIWSSDTNQQQSANLFSAAKKS